MPLEYDTLVSVPSSDGNFKSALENADLGDLTDALDARAKAGSKTAFNALRAEIHRRWSENITKEKERMPNFEAYQAELAERQKEKEREHYCFEHSSPIGRATMLREGYVPRDGNTSLTRIWKNSEAMPKHSSAKLTAALAVIAQVTPVELATLTPGQMCNSCTFDPDEWGRRAQAMIANVDDLKSERAKNAIMTGLFFWAVKSHLAHNQFEPWKKTHCAKSRRTIAHFMVLSEKFARTAKLYLPEFIASQQITLALEATGSDVQAYKAKLEKFVGKCGLTELYLKHDVIKRGGCNSAAQPKTPAEKQAAWAERSLAEAKGAFNALHTLGEKWKLCDDDQLALAISNSKKFIKRAEKWLATQPPQRLALAFLPSIDGETATEAGS